MDVYRLFIKPSAVKELTAKLSGDDKYRIRQGDFRVIYLVSDERRQVVVFKIGHRREIYR